MPGGHVVHLAAMFGMIGNHHQFVGEFDPAVLPAIAGDCLFLAENAFIEIAVFRGGLELERLGFRVKQLGNRIGHMKRR